MPPITEYRILQRHDPDVLVKDVEEYLRSGWRLHGPLVIDPAPDSDSFTGFIQAMVR